MTQDVPRFERQFCGLAVADLAIAEWYARVFTMRVAAGVTIAVPVTDQPEFGIRFFILEDPEGNPIQVFENLAQESPSLR